jgi:hypothetical protein
LFSQIKLINYFLSQRICTVLVEGEMYTPWDIQAGVAQDSLLSLTLYSIYKYINYTPQISGVYLGVFADGTCIYVKDHREKCPQNVARGLSAVEIAR